MKILKIQNAFQFCYFLQSSTYRSVTKHTTSFRAYQWLVTAHQTTGNIVAIFQQQSDVTFYKKYKTKRGDLPARMKSIAKKQKWKHFTWILIEHKWGYRRAVRMWTLLPSGKPNVQPEELCEGKCINLQGEVVMWRGWRCPRGSYTS